MRQHRLVASPVRAARPSRRRAPDAGRRLRIERLEDRQLLSTWAFDFGTASSPVAAGYSRITERSRYASTVGHGWTSSGIQTRDRLIGNELQRDLAMTETGPMSFAVDLSSGIYDLTLTMGDASYARAGQSVWIEGRQLEVVATARGQFAQRTYRIEVTDGRLDLELRGANGGSSTALNAMVVELIEATISQPVEPAEPSTTLLVEDFEDAGLTGRGWYDGSRFTLGDGATPGTRSLQYSLVQGATSPTEDVVRHLFRPTDVATLSFDLKLSADWTWNNLNAGPHLFYFLTTADPAYRGPAFSHLTLYAEPADGKLRLIAQDSLNKSMPHGTTQGLSGNYSPNYTSEDVVFQPGRWHHVEVTFKLNSLDLANDLPNADGELLGWVDGRLLVQRTGLVFRTTDYPDMAINQLLIGPYMHGGAPRDQQLWIDNVKVESVVPREAPAVAPGPAPQAPRSLDFGPATGTAESGYRGVPEWLSYTPDRGYGWTTPYVKTIGRATGTALTRDFATTEPGRPLGLRVDLPDGAYEVTITAGDTEDDPGAQTLRLEGTLVDTIDAPQGQAVRRTYRVVVADGHLDLLLRGAEESTAAYLNGLSITAVPTAPAPDSTTRRFDFGTWSSPLAEGASFAYTAVDESAAYTAARGYGWTTRSVQSRNREAVGDPLTRDLVMVEGARPLGFRLDLPNGEYAVTITAADLEYGLRPEMVSLEGTVMDTIAAPRGQSIQRTYRVTVTDGHLDLELRPAADSTTAAISGLEVTRIPVVALGDDLHEAVILALAATDETSLIDEVSPPVIAAPGVPLDNGDSEPADASGADTNRENGATAAPTVRADNEVPVAAGARDATTEDTLRIVVVPNQPANDPGGIGHSMAAAPVSGPAEGAPALSADNPFPPPPNVGADSLADRSGNGPASGSVAPVGNAGPPMSTDVQAPLPGQPGEGSVTASRSLSAASASPAAPEGGALAANSMTASTPTPSGGLGRQLQRRLGRKAGAGSPPARPRRHRVVVPARWRLGQFRRAPR